MKYTQRRHSLFFRIPLPFTTFSLDEDCLRIHKGFLRDREADVRLYNIVDVRLEQTLLERLLRLGTVTCYLAGHSHAKIVLNHIGQAREISAK